MKKIKLVPLAVLFVLLPFMGDAFPSGAEEVGGEELGAEEHGSQGHGAAKPSSGGHGDVHWGYEGEGGPANWGDLKPEFNTCKTGKQQSPINITAARKEDLEGLATMYQSTPLEVVNNGHAIQVNYAPGSIMEIGGKDYALLQFHFHSPSEHLVQGKPYDMIAHLVHKASDGSLAVIGVFLTEGKENSLIQKVWDYLPAKAGEKKTVAEVTLNVADLLPKDMSYYHYYGSLTTPPCTEGVAWYVLKTPVEVSAKQLAQFRAVMHGNVRPPQPLHGRFAIQTR